MVDVVGLDAGKDVVSLDFILKDRPKFHEGELEVAGSFDPGQSFWTRANVGRLVNRVPMFYGIGDEAARFIGSSLDKGSRSLEIGLGLSTLAFIMSGSEHVCITRIESEIELLKAYCVKHRIDLTKATFVCESSDKYLPTHPHRELDVVLVDGKHAFPFPVLDWYFTADQLKRSGLMIIDDVQLKTVRILKDFLDVDPRWKRVAYFDQKTVVYEKLADEVHDVAWHMQPYAFHGSRVHRVKALALRAANRLRGRS